MKKYERMVLKTLSRHVAAVVLSVASLPLYAQTMLNLPAQPLAATLMQLQRQGGVNIIAASDIIAGRSAPPLSGNLTIKQALARVLEGSGLRVEEVNPQTFVITKAAPAPGSATVPVAARAMDPAAASGEPVSVTITGTATGAPAMVARNSGTATRSDTPIAETPISIQVVNRELLSVQQAKSVSDALGYLSGVAIINTGEASPSVYIRGRAANTMSNGVNDGGNANSLQSPIAGIERVEVIKGGASILAGVANPGGVINVETKQPTAQRVRELTVQAGNYGNLLSAIDLGGALSDDQRLTYRLVISGERSSHSYGDYDGVRASYIAPSLGWKSGGSEGVLAYQHQYNRNPVSPVTLLDSFGPVSYEGRPTPLANSNSRQDTVTLTYKQQLADNVQFESKTQYQDSVRGQDSVYSLYSGYEGTANYLGYNTLSSYYSLSTDNLVRAKFTMGDVAQTLVAGFAYNRTSFTLASAPLGFIQGTFPMPSAPPVTGAISSYGGSTYFSNLYVQDQITWQRLHVLAGVGYGTAHGGALPSQSKASPSIGALFDVTKDVGVYVNALRSFQQGSGQLADLSTAPPSSGESIEAGVKATVLGGKLTISADVFRSTLNNMLIFDTTSYLPTLADGAFTYRGAELDVTGQLARGLNATFSYTYSHIDEPSGLDPRSMPYHAGTAWLNYDLQGETLRGWGGGIGLQSRSAYYGATSLGERGKVPGNLKTDLTVYYHAKDWTATLGIKNLFDRTIYQPNGSIRVAVAPDRQFYLTGTYNF
jgi:iron complex outermembrane receptor protein